MRKSAVTYVSVCDDDTVDHFCVIGHGEYSWLKEWCVLQEGVGAQYWSQKAA